MTRLPRGISGRELARRLQLVGFIAVHQTGSHIICRTERNGRHTEAIPDHKELKTGLLASILSRIALHLQLSRDELLRLIEL